MRIGIGYDIHKLIQGRKLILGGVEIANDLGLLGHSDADVVVHAIIDSLLGAVNSGDIGRNFPDNDPKYKDIDSLKLLKETNKILIKEGFEIINIDTNIICQKPKLAPYIEDMKKNIANCLAIPTSSISIKAKTNENLDSVGKSEAIQAQAVCLVDFMKLAKD